MNLFFYGPTLLPVRIKWSIFKLKISYACTKLFIFPTG